MVRCADCGANFASFDRCRSHIACVHFGWLDYHCLYCQQKGVESRFGGQHEVQEHIDTAHQQQEYAAVCMQGANKITRIDAKISTEEDCQRPEPEIVFLKEEANDEFETVPKIARVAVCNQTKAAKPQPFEGQVANSRHIKPELILIEDDDDFEPFGSNPVLDPVENECKAAPSEAQIGMETKMQETSESASPFTPTSADFPIPEDLAEDMQRYMTARPLDIIQVEMQRFLRRRERPWTYSVEQTNVKPRKPPTKSLARYGVREYRAVQAANRLLYNTVHTLKCDRLAEGSGAIQCSKVIGALKPLKQGDMYVVREAVSVIDPLLADLIVQTAIFWQVPNDNNYRDVAMGQLWGMRAWCNNTSFKHRSALGRSQTAADHHNNGVLPSKRRKRSGPPFIVTCC